MLASLQIRDIVLIDRLDLSPADGLTALTGETGAGKSIILDSLGLALGAKSERALLRHGARQGSVTAIFDVPPDHAARLLAQESGLAADDGPLILRRTLSEDGRSRAFVNDEAVSLGLLRALGDQLVEIHGQHDDRGLLDASAHRALLDAYGGLVEDTCEVARRFEQWRSAQDALAAHEAQAAADRADADYLAHVLKELDDLAPQEGEEDTLAQERSVLSHAEKITQGFAEAQALLMRDGGVSTRLAQAMRRLERIADKAGGKLEPALDALERAAVEAAEAEAILEAVERDLVFDPRRLELIEERLHALRAIARKHGVMPDALCALREDIARKVTAIGDSGAQSQRLARARDEARASYEDKARRLREKRSAAAVKLDKAVNRELKPLKLDKATFATRIDTLDAERWGAAGGERVSFEISTNPGAPMGPLSKIASGGELARFILALKVVLASTGSAETLIFDEVDRGVGGAVAAAVGERLAMLSRDAQVLVVTHSPQVAARASHHYKIAKASTNGAAAMTRVDDLGADERREEIARMLSGAEVTDEARAAAKRLLSDERPPPRKAARA